MFNSRESMSMGWFSHLMNSRRFFWSFSRETIIFYCYLFVRFFRHIERKLCSKSIEIDWVIAFAWEWPETHTFNLFFYFKKSISICCSFIRVEFSNFNEMCPNAATKNIFKINVPISKLKMVHCSNIFVAYHRLQI